MTQPQAYAEQNEISRLREELKLAEAWRGELVRALEKINTCEITVADFKSMPLKDAFVKMAETVSKEALTSQLRPKILDVYEAARGFMEHGSAKDGTHGTILKNALAAMEKEGV